MSLLPFGHVSIVGARDRDLEVMLASAGMRTTAVPASALATLAHPAARPNAVIVVDLRDSTQFPAALSQLKRHHPETAIVLVVPALDATLMLEAMRAGVTECVVEPVAESELRSAILRVSQHLEAPAAGQVFAIVGAKGGVGATTLAVNVATELAKVASTQTLLIDLHPSQGDAAVMLGVEPRFSVLDALENTHRLDETFFRGLVTTSKAGVQMLASSDRIIGEPLRTEAVRTVVAFASRLYRYTIVDVPRLDGSLLEGLDELSRIVLVTNQELVTVRNTSRLVAMLKRRHGKDGISVVVSRFDAQSEISREDIEQVVGAPVRHVVPSDYRLALRALNKGRPLSLDNHNRLATVFHDVARDLAGIQQKPSATSANAGVFGRFGGRRS